MNDHAFITVFTPAYNRAHTLPRTYESLRQQDMKSFEWLVVDDGSSDNTRELVEEWIKNEKDFKIRYIYKENGGMHTAYNTAYANIDTELNICIDSDDKLAEGAIRKIYDLWQAVKDKDYAGIIGLDADFDGNIIGGKFDDDLIDTTYSEFYGKHSGSGDKKFVYRTDIVNQYPPFPEFEGEHYVGINALHVFIAQDYRLAVLNEVLCDVEYQADGHSTIMFKEYVTNPKGFAYLRKVCMQYPMSKKDLIKSTLHYISTSIIMKNHHYISESPRKALTVLLTPAGWLLSIFVRKKAKEQMTKG